MPRRSAAGTAQLLAYFYDLVGLYQAGGNYRDAWGLIGDLKAEDPLVAPNAVAQDMQFVWGQARAQVDAMGAVAAGDLGQALEAGMWSWAPGSFATATSDLFERYQIRVNLDTTTTEPGADMFRTVTLDGPLDQYATLGDLLSAVTDVLQQQLDDGDTPPEGGWGPAGPGTVTDLSDIAIMRL